MNGLNLTSLGRTGFARIAACRRAVVICAGMLALPATDGFAALVTGGGRHSAALWSDGASWYWGDNTRGQTNTPAAAVSLVDLAAGFYHNVGLRSDGRVVAWGDNLSGQTNVPLTATSVVAVAAGYSHSLALRANGTVVGWGDNAAGQTAPPNSLSNAVAIAGGEKHSLALTSNGLVVAWGKHVSGIFSNNVAIPVGLSNVTAIAAGANHDLALLSNGTVVAWGVNSGGQTVVDPALSNVVAIAAGERHSMALKSDGTVVCWGDNVSGQCSVPVGLSNVVGIAAGYRHSLALRGDGTIVGWGFNLYGQVTIPPDADLPVATIGNPAPIGVVTSIQDSVVVSGSAFDRQGVVLVTWSNAASGATGACAGTTAWSSPSIGLPAGTNTIVIAVYDAAGNVGTATLVMLFAPLAPVIPNPSFEANSFTNFPGYIPANAPIEGWNGSPECGLNPAGSSPFADNGAVPDGVNVAFIQSLPGVTSTLSTVISGLSSGRTYRISFRANSRDATAQPLPLWSINGGALVPFAAWPPVGGANAYYTNNAAFVATGPTAALVLANAETVNDSAVVVDDFRIAQDYVVTTTNDGVIGSLRQILLDAFLAGGARTVTFDPALAGAAVVLTNELVLPNRVTIDGMNLPQGVTIDGGPGVNRIATVPAGVTSTIAGVTLTGGNGSGDWGGAIVNYGTIRLSHCTLTGNSSPAPGGALAAFSGRMDLYNCTISGNTGTLGGALGASGPLSISLSNCTVSGNAGGGIFMQFGGTVTVSYCVLAGNGGSDLQNDGMVVRNGTNLVEASFLFGSVVGSGVLVSTNPLLAPLGDYGGPTRTMALQAGSPARERGAGSSSSVDQRGSPVVGIRDLGAYEAGVFSNYTMWVWETLVPTNADRSVGADVDGDGFTNFGEWLALTDPGNAASFLRVASIGGTNVSFASVPNRTYRLQQAATPTSPWTNSVAAPLAGNGATRSFSIPPGAATQQLFRILVEP